MSPVGRHRDLGRLLHRVVAMLAGGSRLKPAAQYTTGCGLRSTTADEPSEQPRSKAFRHKARRCCSAEHGAGLQSFFAPLPARSDVKRTAEATPYRCAPTQIPPHQRLVAPSADRRHGDPSPSSPATPPPIVWPVEIGGVRSLARLCLPLRARIPKARQPALGRSYASFRGVSP
jgi:hypothetical protein